MDDSSSFERRYSFNMAQCDPVAESTHLNGSNFSRSSLSPKYRSFSSLCLNSSPTVYNNKSIANINSKNVKIDARIATDVQSKGLASRIVKYHETGTMLNRNMSAHNLYTKPGQFPAVTLKKTNLPYRATKQELSMIRIPPPEKSSFYGNTISSLLRSSSVIGLQCKRTEDLSRENRPIIHPPPTETDMAPTRSVLDVLKEISRKRINSDDLESEEKSKKCCNRDGNNDIVDTVNNTSTIPQNCISPSLSCQRYKRQRDCITPHKGVQLSEIKTSPEHAQKRVCNYNNDITSSLSSSIKYKAIESSHNLNQTMPTSKAKYEIHKSKMQRYNEHQENKNSTQVDMRFENLENTLIRRAESINPVTPIPATPCVQDQNNAGGVVSTQAASEAFYNGYKESTNLKLPANKPRLTLFNKKCDESERAEVNEQCGMLTGKNDDLNNMNDFSGIPFVKPKKITSKKCLRNPVMERTQKSKLALMLSGLRGELYQNTDVDELDSSNEKQKLKITNDNNTIAVTSALNPTSAITTLTTVISSNNIEPINVSSSLNFSKIVKANTLPSSSSSNSSANKTLSPLVGLKLTQSNSLPENTANILSVDDKKKSEQQSTSTVPVLGGFSFGATNTSSSLSNSNMVKNCKTITASTSGSNTFSSGQPEELASSLRGTTNNLTVTEQLSTKSNSLQFPSGFTTVTAITTNTKPFSNSVGALTASKTFSYNTNINASIPTSSQPSPSVGGSSPFNGVAKVNNSFNFALPSTPLPITTTQSTPTMFGTSTSSSTLTKPVIVTATTSTPTLSTTVAVDNLGLLNSAPSFTFNSSKKSQGNETTKSSADGAVAPGSFNTDGNLNANSAPTFGTNTFSIIKTNTTNSSFPFNSDDKIQNTSPSDHNNQKLSTQNVNNDFNSNSNLFSSQCFNSKATGSSSSIFATVGNSSENSAFGVPGATSSFESSSVKTNAQTILSNANNKSGVMVSANAFGSDSTNNNTSTPFSFGSKPTITSTTNSNNASTAGGGFSFSSAVSNSAENGIFGFGSKSSGQTIASNNNFGFSTPQHKSFTFGSSANKSDNSANIFGGMANKQSENTMAGFSFGLATNTKSPSFSFGTVNTSPGVSVGNASGFSFGTSAAPKADAAPINKPFSFGLPQSVQQKQLQSIPVNNVSSLNIFGVNESTKITPPSPFNFNPGSATNLQSNNVSATKNIFAPPAANITTGPSDRPIRRATRRLLK